MKAPRPSEYYSSFADLLTAAIKDLSEHGYVSEERLQEWIIKLRNAAEREIGPEWEYDAKVRAGFERLFERFVDGVKLPTRVEGVKAFTKEMLKPRLYAELDRRIKAAADLIRANRVEAIDRTLKRFSGWATSIPPGGDSTIDRRETRTEISKPYRNFSYQRRLVDNDQGHKLVSNISYLVAMDVGAIAGIWHSHGASDRSYDARPDHLKRDGKIFIVRDSWAYQQGLVKQVNGFIDSQPLPGMEVNCRCWFQYITSPRRLPDEFLTRKGQEWIANKQPRGGMAA